MPSTTSSSRRPPTTKAILARGWPFVVLVLQNLAVFQNHYFRDHGFPWDFVQGYYAMVAFWTALVSQGVYPAWIPFDSMGLPFSMNLQSGIHYPPLWAFPILRIEYTLHAAVVFQCLHVLLGALGMFCFLRLALATERSADIYALFGAFVFQLFGGFYSNAEHPDIIRAFALMPWCLYVFSLHRTSARQVVWRHLLIPGIILLVATGAYPGNFISAIAVISLYVVLQLVHLRWQGESTASLTSVSAWLLLLTALGFALSLFHLGPPWQFSEYLYRSGQVGKLLLASLGTEQLPALFLDNSVVPGEISMTSTYVALPALILLTFVPLRVIQKHWPMAGVFGLAVLMVSGPSSFLWFVLTKLVKPLQFSRFPASDYRIFVAITLIYFAVFAMKALVDREITWRSFLFRILIVFLWFSEGIYVSYPVLRIPPVYFALAVFVATLGVLTIYFFTSGKWKHPVAAIAIPVFVLVACDAWRVLPAIDLPQGDAAPISTWGLTGPDFSHLYEREGWPLLNNGHLLTYSILQNMPATRPPRIETAGKVNFSWAGYITGRYILFYSPMMKSAYEVLQQPVYKRYMLLEWTPVFFDAGEYDASDSKIHLTPQELNSRLGTPQYTMPAPVQQTRYGINEIDYEVSLSRPVLMVENETYFPGWTATLLSGDKTSAIQAVPISGIFRGWFLPSGNYHMVARFELANAGIYNAIGVLALFVWLVLVVWKFRLATRTEVNGKPSKGRAARTRRHNE